VPPRNRLRVVLVMHPKTGIPGIRKSKKLMRGIKQNRFAFSMEMFRWNDFRSLCEFNKEVVPVLELKDVPSAEEVDRWAGETVKAIFVSTGSQFN